jgi:hypothetical protein
VGYLHPRIVTPFGNLKQLLDGTALRPVLPDRSFRGLGQKILRARQLLERLGEDGDRGLRLEDLVLEAE